MRALLAAVVLAAAAAAQAGPPLPMALAAELPMLKPLGEGRLRWFGLHVYDSSLWVPGEAWSFDRVFALDIRYAMNIRGRGLTMRSLEEMRRLGFSDPGKLKRWEEVCSRVISTMLRGGRLEGSMGIQDRGSCEGFKGDGSGSTRWVYGDHLSRSATEI